MGLRFQRRIRVLPGLQLNLSRSGVGVSIGGRGAHVGITARGQRYASAGLPGTGISWREYAKRRRPSARIAPGPPRLPAYPAPKCELCAPGHAHVSLGLVVALALFFLAIVGLLMSHQ